MKSTTKKDTLFLNENHKKLLIIFFCEVTAENDRQQSLADLKELKVLDIGFAIKHVELYKKQNVSVLLACEDGRVIDFHDKNNQNLFLLPNGQRKNKLEKLLKNTSPLSDGKFEKALILGHINVYSATLSDQLLDANKKYLHSNAFVRVQICNFMEQQVENQTETVINKIIPSGCKVSAPEGFSVISTQDLRALDIVGSKSFSIFGANFDNAIEFNQIKVHLKKLLDNKITDADLPKKINEVLSNAFGNSEDCSLKGIKLIAENGMATQLVLNFFEAPHSENQTGVVKST